MATQRIRPEPGALERQFRGQRRRTVRRRASAIGLAAALTFAAIAFAVQATSDTGAGDDRVPAEEGAGEALLRISGFGYGFSADGTSVFTRVEDAGTVYDAETGALIQTLSGRGDGVVAFSPDGDRFVSVRGDPGCCQTYVQEAETGDQLFHFRNACCYATFSPDGQLIAIPQNVPHTSVMELETGTRVKRVGTWGGTSFSPDGRRLLITPDRGSAEARVIGYVFDVFGDSTDPVLTLRANGAGNVVDVYAAWDAWSRDGSMIAMPTSTGKVVVWDAETGGKLHAIDAAGDFTFTAFGPGGLLATASTTGRVLVYDLSSGSAERVLTIDAYGRSVDHVHFDPSGDRLMTAAWNRPTKIWNVEV